MKFFMFLVVGFMLSAIFSPFANAAESTQSLWVKASAGPTSVAQMLVFENGAWINQGSEFPVSVGRNGTTAQKFEGDGKTPEGIFPLTQMFGKNARTDLKLNYQQSLPEDKWIDDVNHPDYNKWIRGETTANSYENLLRTDHQYDLLAVVGYNMTPIVPGKGSAIFVHIWLSPGHGTSGCVAMDAAQMETLAQWLDPAKNPTIQIGGNL